MGDVGLSRRVLRCSSRVWWIAPLFFIFCGLFAALVSAGQPWVVSAFVGALVLLQIGVGALIAHRLLGRALGTAEFLGLGAATGTAVAVLTGILVSPLGLWARMWGWVIVSSALGIVLGLRLIRHRELLPLIQKDCEGVTAAWIGGLAIAVPLTLVNIARYPIQGPWSRYHPDIAFFEAVGTSVARLGFDNSIFMVGDQIRYHWFAYLWPAQVTLSTGLDPFVALTRLLPLVVTVGLVTIVAGWAGRLSRVWWVPSLAVGLVVLGGFVGASYGIALNFDSPSTAVSGLWLVAFALVSRELLHRPSAGATCAVVAGFLLAGSKVSAALVAASVWVFIAAIGWTNRKPWRRGAISQAVGLIAGALLSFFLFVYGSSSPGDVRLLTWERRASTVQGLDAGTSWWGVAIGTLILIAAVLPRAAGILGLRAGSWDGLLGIGLVVASVMPILLLSQGVNELWFSVAAAGPIAVLSAVGLGRAWTKAQAVAHVSPWMWLAIGLGIAGALIAMLLWPTGMSGTTSWRLAGPLFSWAFAIGVGAVAFVRFRMVVAVPTFATVLVLAALVGRGIPLLGDVGGESATGRNLTSTETAFSAFATGPGSNGNQTLVSTNPGLEWTAGLQEGAMWLRRNAQLGDVVATTKPMGTMLPAVSGIGAFLAGREYVDLYGSRVMSGEVEERAMISETMADSIVVPAPVCDSEASWLWLEGAQVPDWVVIEFSNAEVSIGKIRDNSCVE